mgnify:FL=1
MVSIDPVAEAVPLQTVSGIAHDPRMSVDSVYRVITDGSRPRRCLKGARHFMPERLVRAASGETATTAQSGVNQPATGNE